MYLEKLHKMYSVQAWVFSGTVRRCNCALDTLSRHRALRLYVIDGETIDTELENSEFGNKSQEVNVSKQL